MYDCINGFSVGAGINLSYSDENFNLLAGMSLNSSGVNNVYLVGEYHNRHTDQRYSYLPYMVYS